MSELTLNADYRAFVAELKNRVRRAQLSASLSVNRELIVLYWSIGRDILSRQATEGWGARVIPQLSRDLRSAFPDMKGSRSETSSSCVALVRHTPTPKL